MSYPKRVIFFLNICLLIHGGKDDLEKQDDATVRIPKECLDLSYSSIYCIVCKNNFDRFSKEFSRKALGVFKKFASFSEVHHLEEKKRTMMFNEMSGK